VECEQVINSSHPRPGECQDPIGTAHYSVFKDRSKPRGGLCRAVGCDLTMLSVIPRRRRGRLPSGRRNLRDESPSRKRFSWSRPKIFPGAWTDPGIPPEIAESWKRSIKIR